MSSAGPTAGETTDPHPWTRYFARSLDIVVGGFVLGFILGLLAPSVLKMPNAGLGFLILVIWIFVEAGLLATWGTTPGKWLLGTTVRTADGAKLSGGAALRRSFDVWLRGMGVGIPLISIFTMIKAHNRLKAEGRTLWDANGGLVVSHAPQKAWKIALAVLLVIFWVIVVAAGS